MKRTRIFTALLAVLCIIPLLPLAGAMSVRMDPVSAGSGSHVMMAAALASDNYPISAGQAKNSIRLFMNNLSLDPVLVSTGSLEIGNYYEFQAGTDSFSVNQNSGVVEFAHFGANSANSAQVTITRDQAYAIATAYAGEKYDGFSAKSWKLIVDKVRENYDWVWNATSTTMIASRKRPMISCSAKRRTMSSSRTSFM